MGLLRFVGGSGVSYDGFTFVILSERSPLSIRGALVLAQVDLQGFSWHSGVMAVGQAANEVRVQAEKVGSSRTFVILSEKCAFISSGVKYGLVEPVVSGIRRQSLESPEEVMSDNMELVEGAPVGSGDAKAVDVSETENVLILLGLEGTGVDIEETCVVLFEKRLTVSPALMADSCGLPLGMT
jgi:hypothetical protein